MSVEEFLLKSNTAAFIVTAVPDGVFATAANEMARKLPGVNEVPFFFRSSFPLISGEYEERMYCSVNNKIPDSFSVYNEKNQKFLCFTIIPVEEQVVIMVSEDNSINNNVRAAFEVAGQKLNDALEEAREASAAKTKFLANMSHDIRTPMNAIMGMADLALKHTDSVEKMVDYVQKVKSASNHLLTLINEVLDMSRIESGKISLNNAEFSLGDLLHDISVIIKHRAQSAGITYKEHYIKITNESFLGDSSRIGQILTNLLNNAVKFTEAGGNVEFSVEERRDSSDSKSLLIFTVKDSGMGMTEEFTKKLFTPFERSEEVYKRQIEGTGLGLAITKQLCEMMGGSIEIKTEVNKGTTFTVSLRLLPVLQKTSSNEMGMYAGLGAVIWSNKTMGQKISEFLAEEAMFSEIVEDSGQVIIKANMLEKHDELWGVICCIDVNEEKALSVISFLTRRFGPLFPIVIISEADWNEKKADFSAAGVDAFISYPLFRNSLRSNLYKLSRRRDTFFVEEVTEEHKWSDKKKILLVEDNELNREIVLDVLSDYGIQCDIAVNGKEGVELFNASEEGTYAIILMDVQMPVMDGHEASRRIRDLDRSDATTVCITAMTANAFAEDARMARAAGMNEFLPKPFDVKRLETIFDKWLKD